MHVAYYIYVLLCVFNILLCVFNTDDQSINQSHNIKVTEKNV